VKWWSRLWRSMTGSSFAGESRWIRLTLPGWNEEAPRDGLRIWRDSDGDVLSLATPAGDLGLLHGSEPEVRHWCRELAQKRGAGLIEVDGIGPSTSLIYKRLQMPAYVYTGMFISHVEAVTLVWTIVAGERGTTGVREAVLTSNLMSAGKLTLDDYRSGWARDPYEPAYQGVDRRVLGFMSDDESFDEQFPQHPLSKVGRVLRALPAAIQFATHKPQSSIS
jgi:hypothetical protein